MRKRALLLSGGVNHDLDRPRYRNDVEAYYRLLTTTYGYQESDVRMYVGSGLTPFRFTDGTTERVVDVHPARPKEVREALQWLAELGAEDRIFLMVTDHGTEDGISLWGKSQYLAPSTIASIFAASQARKILVFGQCHGGVFGQYVPINSVVCCSCDLQEQSYPLRAPAKGIEPSYDEFLYHLAGALGGIYPDGQPLDAHDPIAPPGQISINAAFRYARDHDHWFINGNEYPRLFDPHKIADDIGL